MKCECGCGEIVTVGRRFISGHNTRGMKFPGSGYKKWETRRNGGKKKRRVVYCRCGCREKVIPGNSFVYGHHSRGLVRSEDFKRRDSESHKGRRMSAEAKLKLSGVRTGMFKGSKSPSWKGAKFSNPHLYMGIAEFLKMVEKVKDRDGRTCIVCDESRRLHIHHVVPVRIGYLSKICDDPSNLVTLCINHHFSFEGGSTKKWKLLLPLAYSYLSQFGYKRMLLRRYYRYVRNT